MEYTQDIIINLPRERVVELISDPTHLDKWQQGFQGIKHVSGEPGQPGAQSELTYKQRNREQVMRETILTNNLPETLSMRYQMGNVNNIQVNHFHAISPEQTRWVAETTFEFGFPMKLFAPFMKGLFCKQSYSFMEAFKAFAES